MQSVTIYEENSDEALEQFVLEKSYLVKKIALFIKRKLPSHIELDDLLQSGLIGLLDAKKSYKPEFGASFDTYASIRIKGAILDALRKNSWLSRETIKSMKKMSEAITKIEQRDQKQATTEDIIAELGITQEEHFKLSQEINMLHVASLDELTSQDFVLASDMDNPENDIQHNENKEQLKLLLMELPEREQLVLSLYYVEELTFKQIGEVLELTEARICQLHSQAILRLRGKIDSNQLISHNTKSSEKLING